MSEIQSHIPYAIMVNGHSLKQWQAETIQKLNDSGLYKYVLIYSNPDKIMPQKSLLRKLPDQHTIYNYLMNRPLASISVTDQDSDTLECLNEKTHQPHELNSVKINPEELRQGKTRKNLYRLKNVFNKDECKVNIYRVLKILPESFNEVGKAAINPVIFDHEYLGLHTYSVFGDRYVVNLKKHYIGLTVFNIRLNQNRLKRRSHV